MSTVLVYMIPKEVVHRLPAGSHPMLMNLAREIHELTEGEEPKRIKWRSEHPVIEVRLVPLTTPGGER